MSLGEAVNELARTGLACGKEKTTPFRQRTVSVGLKIDVTNVADALETLDAYDAKEER